MTTARAHTRALHCQRLNSLCRLCGGRSQKLNGTTSVILCENYMDVLAAYFGINISEETYGTVYPSTLCFKCRLRLLDLRRSHLSVESLMAAQEQMEQAERVKTLWVPFDSTVSETDCGVCSQFLKQAKVSRPTKQSCITNRKQQRVKLETQMEQSASGGGNRVSDSSSSCDDSQPQASSTPQLPNARERFIDCLSSHGVASSSTSRAGDTSTSVGDSDSLVLPSSSTSKALTQTPVPKTLSTPVKGASSLQPGEDGQSAPDLPAELILRPIKELQAPLTDHEEIYLARLVQIKLNQSSDKLTLVCRRRGRPLVLRKLVGPKEL